MKDLTAFLHHNMGFVTLIVAIACVLLGRIWSDRLNRGEITDPLLMVRKEHYYKVINTYVPSMWTEDWIVGNIICLKQYHSKLLQEGNRDIYVSGDRVRFTDGGPVIGSMYQVIATKKSTGGVVMKLVKKT